MAYQAQIVELIQENTIIRSRDLDSLNIPRVYLRRLHDKGVIERISRGVYSLPDKLDTEYANLIELSVRIPHGIICLLSALEFHQVTTQLPFEIWLAIEGTSWQPRIDYPPSHIVRFSGKAFHYGIEKHEINGVTIQVYSLAKTIADCFKFRNKIGLDVAIEALREGLNDKRVHIDDIWQAAKICRVHNVMRPYLEAIQ